MASITMTMEEFNELGAQKSALENEMVRLQKELTEAKLSSGDPRSTRALTALARHLLTCTRFAVGQLTPEVTKGWPTEDLKRAGELLAMLPDFTVDDVSIQSEFRAFAAECERFERYRASGAINAVVTFPPPQ